MTPRAELVHWAFAAGFLLLGLILLAEAIVGNDVFAMRRWRLYLWPSLAFALGVLLWPVAVFFTNSTLHMLAHASWAEMTMLAGAVQLALVRGKLHSRWWTLSLSFALIVSADRISDPRAEPLALLARRLPPSRDRLDAPRGRDLPARPDDAAATADLERRLRDDLCRARRDALLRSRRRADLRPPLEVRERRRNETRARSLRGGARAARRCLGSRIALRHVASDAVAARRPATSRRAAFRPVRDHHPAGDRGLHRVRAQGVGSRGHNAARARRQRAARRPRAGPGLHGALAGDVRRRSHGLGRLHLRYRRHAARRPRTRTARPGPAGPTTPRVGRSSSRSRCSSGRSACGCSYSASRSRRASRTASTASPPRGASRCSTSGSLHS